MKANEGRSGFHYAHIVAIACCAVTLTAVALTYSCAGIFYTPVSAELGVGKGTFAVYMSVLCLSSTLTLPVAGKIMAKRDVRVVLSICVVIVAASFAAMSTFTHVYQFYVAGAFLGMAQAFLFFLTIPTLINRWFKKKVGFYMGICSAFSGVGGVLFNPVGGQMIAAYGWRPTYLAFAAITLVVSLPFTLFAMRGNPADKGLRAYGDDGAAQVGGKLAQKTGVAYADAVKTSAFYLLLLLSFAVAFVTNINFYLPSYAASLGMSITLGATVASASMLGVMVGKILLGYINDKNVISGMTVCFGSGIAGMLMLLFLSAQGVWVIMAGGFLYGISYAGVAVQTPMVVKKVFGDKDYGQIYANIAMASAASSVIGASAWGFIIDGGGFSLTFGIACCVLAVAFVAGYAAVQKSGRFE